MNKTKNYYTKEGKKKQMIKLVKMSPNSAVVIDQKGKAAILSPTEYCAIIRFLPVEDATEEEKGKALKELGLSALGDIRILDSPPFAREQEQEDEEIFEEDAHVIVEKPIFNMDAYDRDDCVEVRTHEGDTYKMLVSDIGSDYIQGYTLSKLGTDTVLVELNLEEYMNGVYMIRKLK